MKSTFSLALLAGFASGTSVTGVTVKSVLTVDVNGYVDITFTPNQAIAIDGTITFAYPTARLALGAPLTAVIATNSTGALDGTLRATASATPGSVVMSRVGTNLNLSGTAPITIKVGPIKGSATGLVTQAFTIATTSDEALVETTTNDVHVADACHATNAATAAGCACTTTATLFLCTEGETCVTGGANEAAACTGANGSSYGSSLLLLAAFFLAMN